MANLPSLPSLYGVVAYDENGNPIPESERAKIAAQNPLPTESDSVYMTPDGIIHNAVKNVTDEIAKEAEEYDLPYTKNAGDFSETNPEANIEFPWLSNVALVVLAIIILALVLWGILSNVPKRIQMMGE